MQHRLTDFLKESVLVEEKRLIEQIVSQHKPWIEGCIEVGYVIVPRQVVIQVGEKTDDLIWVRIHPNYSAKIRIGWPLLIYDLIRNEYIAGVVSAMGYDIEDPQVYERESIYPRVVLTSELIKYGDFEFLEHLPVYGVEPICTLRNENGKMRRGSINFSPHARAPVFLPPNHIILKVLGLPEKGIPYGVIMVGEDLAIDPTTGQYLVYRLRPFLLFEHELVLGSTGKGKTSKCKNDIFWFIKWLNGTVIVFDLHGEYSMISEDPMEEYKGKINDLEINIWKAINAKPTKINDVVVWFWVPASESNKYRDKSTKHVKFFSIKFNEIPPNELQYYLPALSPQGYYVLPSLIREFRREGGKTLEEFYEWLQDQKFERKRVAPATLYAIIRRIASILEEDIFDGVLPDISTDQIFVPGRVNIINLVHVKSQIARRIIVFHVINKVASVKLRDHQNKLPCMMLLIDEAHQFFPKKVKDRDEADYIDRAVRWMARICREGRKFQLRVEISTQSPEDLHPEVIKVVNTITFLGCTLSQAKALENVMNPLPVSKKDLINLETKQAIIWSRDNAKIPIKILIPWPLLKHPIKKKEE